MGDWKDMPLPDGSYSDDSRPWSQQDVVCYLPTFAEQGGTRSRAKYVPVPGLQTFANVGDGPHRGARDVEGKCFVVSGNRLYQVATTGAATELGTIPGTARVSMTHNQVAGGNQLTIGTGDNSYVWDTSDSTLTATGVALSSVDFLNQLVLGVDSLRRFWRYSGLADAKTYNDLDVESAESSPDRIVGGIVSQGEWLVFGERTIEVWQNSPTDATAFQRTTVIEKGCANANTICRLDNSVFFLGNDDILYRLQGYTPVPVSKKAHSAAFRECSASKAFAFTYEDNGYVVYYLTFQDGQTWGYDVTNQRFHRRESFGLDRWRVNTLFKWNGEWFAGDYSSGKLYRLEWRYPYEGCELMPRRIRTGVLHNNGNRVQIHGIKLLANTGMEPAANPADSPPTISGSLPAGAVGEVVSFQYVVTPAYTGQDVAVSLASGALPTGLSVDADGLVTGTRTAEGDFSWTLQASGDCGDPSTYADTGSTYPETVIDPIATYKYLQVALADTTDYSSPAFDDSAWATGDSPFASAVPHPYAGDVGWPQVKNTNWSLNTKLWLRANFTLPEAVDLVFEVFVDNYATVWVNGTEVLPRTGTIDSPSGPIFNHVVDVPASLLVVGDNTIAVLGEDYGTYAYMACRLDVA